MTIRRTRPVGRLLSAVALGLLVLTCAVSVLAADEEKAPEKITWLSYREASNKSRDEDRPMFIHFTAQWCGWCKKMKKETYTDRDVIEYMDANFAAAWVDTEKLPSLAQKYQVSSLPTLWFIDAKGKPLTAVPGYLGPDKLLRVLEYISTKSYETVDYDTWLKQRPKNNKAGS
jgi:thioredoxin-related protein